MIQDPKTMKSPITGGQVTLEWEWRELDFRKEKFRVMFPYYKCADTGEQFTTTESDGVWYAQLHNQYCKKYGIPYMDEIVAVRERYGLSAAKMAAILGFGPNQWRKYEQEEIPNVSNGRMIRSIMNPKVFLDMVESAREVWQTKMNKLLFYIDFLSYRERGMAISGLSYRAIDFGPVPERWERVSASFDEIRVEVLAVGDFEGVMLKADARCDESLFSEEELQVLERVCSMLGGCSSRMLSEKSHQEKAWIENHEQHRMIPFEDAFVLRGM